MLLNHRTNSNAVVYFNFGPDLGLRRHSTDGGRSPLWFSGQPSHSGEGFSGEPAGRARGTQGSWSSQARTIIARCSWGCCWFHRLWYLRSVPGWVILWEPANPVYNFIFWFFFCQMIVWLFIGLLIGGFDSCWSVIYASFGCLFTDTFFFFVFKNPNMLPLMNEKMEKEKQSNEFCGSVVLVFKEREKFNSTWPVILLVSVGCGDFCFCHFFWCKKLWEYDSWDFNFF